MSTRPRAPLRLVADDLSGALDALVPLTASVGEGAVPRVDPPAVCWGAPGSDTTAFCSDSRDVSLARAERRARRFAPWLLDAELSLLKCDSRLRGHPFAEIAACVATCQLERVVLAPALPAQARRVDGARLHTCDESGAWRLEPVEPLQALRGLDLDPLACVPGDALPGGVSVWDAASETDLDRIVAAGRASSGRTLWCGSSGLAGALARALDIAPPTRKAILHPVLGLVGTPHPRTRAQLSELARVAPWTVIAADASGVGSPFARTLDSALRAGRSRCVALAAGPVRNAAEATRAIEDALAHLVEAIEAPATVLVTGGATLQTLSRLLDARALEVRGELEPGMPVCRFLGGRWDGVAVVSKSGGFGERGVLCRIFAPQ